MDEQSIFAAALERESVDERSAFLDEACAGDQSLRNRIEALLKVQKRVGNFMEEPAAPTIGRPPCEGPGTTIDNYKLLEQIGEGGFGIVYLAEQKRPVRRQVALKVIKPGMDTKQVMVRFEAERQALALMDHPCIAKVLDAGASESRRPYFVMELVKGIPITQYCDQCNLPIRERLELFINVCRAVQHAHQKGIIHRDIKPSNLMIAIQDGRPTPKIIDFGVAKAINQRLTEETLRTGYAQMLGTPLYMSPEQAEMSALEVDTRTDIYSLGVLLYELLTGTTPFERSRLNGANYDEIRRVIRDEDPPRPSARLSTLGQQATTAAECRRSDPRRLSQFVRGDLDWIAMKALEKDRTRRYETANALARDIERFMNEEPVEARPPSAAYQIRKFVKRNKVGFATATAAFFILVIAAIGLAVSNSLIAHERNKAVTDKTRAERAEALAESRLKEALVAKSRATQLSERLARQLYTADMNLALNDWEAGNVERVHEILKRHIPGPSDQDLRGFEWYYLWRLYQQSSTAPRMTCDGYIWSMALSPTGETLAAGLYGGVSLWNVATHSLRMRLPTTEKVIHFVAYSPDGKLLATSGPENSIRVWEVKTGTLLRQLAGHENWIFSLAFSPDGSTIASGSWDKTVKLWEVASGVCLATLEGHAHEVLAVVFSPDGRQLASSGWDGSIRLWDVAARKQSSTLGGHEDLVISLSYSPDGRVIASASRDKTVRLWDVESRSQRIMLRGFRNYVTSVAFSPDGKTVATGDGDNTVRLWDAQTGEPLRTLKGHSGAVMAVAFSADSKTLVTGSWDRTVRLWDLASPDPPTALKPENIANAPKSRQDLQSVDVTSDGAVVAAGDIDGRLHLWNLETGAPIQTWQAHENWITDLDFHRNNEILASCSWDHSIKLWKLSDPLQPLTTLTDHDGHVQAIAFSPNGRLLASASRDATIRLWNVETFKCESVLSGHGGWVNDLSFSRDGEHLASSGDDGTIRIWSVKERQQVNQLPGGDAWITGVSFSPRDQNLAVAAFDGSVRLWDAEESEELTVMRGHSAVITAVFSPDGRVLATGGADYTIKLWDVETGDERGWLVGHTDDVNALVFAPNGELLLSASDDGTVRVWRAAIGDEPQ